MIINKKRLFKIFNLKNVYLGRLTLDLLVRPLIYSDLHCIIYLEYPFFRCTGTAHLNLFFNIFNHNFMRNHYFVINI